MIEEVLTGMREWRTAHPQASFAEIEAAVDERLGRVRARMLEEAALASAAADMTAMPAGERPQCDRCGEDLEARGRQPRRLQVQGAQAVTLVRSYASCPRCGAGLFPPR